MMSRPLSRRQFFKVAGVTTGSAVVFASLQNLLGAQQVDAAQGQLFSGRHERIVPGICRLCPSGCGLLARVSEERVVKLEGNPMHPVNQGSLCPKGQAALELLYNPDRLTGPIRRIGEKGEGRWEPISWEQAIELVAQKLLALRASGFPHQAALMTGEGSGQLPAFLDHFMRVFGSPNTISSESLNLAAAKLGVYFTQGVYDYPAYDLENSNYVLVFGGSLLEAGPRLQRMISGYSFLRRGKASRSKVVVVDPRQGVSGAKADEWIPITPGSDGALALSMANVIIRLGLVDDDFIHHYSFGFEDFVDNEGNLRQGFKHFVLENYAPEQGEAITGIEATTISRLAGEFALNRPAVAILPGKGGLLNGSIGGVYAAMAIQCLNALVGSIEAPGGVLTQRYPNLRDWPEVAEDSIATQGCLAERLDGIGTHFPLGRSAYQAVADRILDGYPLEVLFLHRANPVYEAPGGERFRQAFQKVPLVVSFASFLDESAEYADLVLPEPSFLESSEDHFGEGLGHPVVGLSHAAIPARFGNMSVGDFFLRLAKEVGDPLASALPWETYEDLLAYRLSQADFDWETYNELGVWAIPGYRYARRGSQKWLNEVIGAQRENSPRDGHFDFYSRELECLLVDLNERDLRAKGISQGMQSAGLPHHEETNFAGDPVDYPFTLNVITIMSLGSVGAAANLPTLQEISGMTRGETWDSWLEMNPDAARSLGLKDKNEVWVESPFGKVQTKVRIVNELRPDVVNLPYNQGHSAIGRWAKNRGVNGLELLDPGSEPLSGLAKFTNTRVKVYRA
jgi:anaerobic selenocysteine-containing dehydrogenase